MECINCKKVLKPTDSFCPRCGTKVEEVFLGDGEGSLEVLIDTKPKEDKVFLAREQRIVKENVIKKDAYKFQITAYFIAFGFLIVLFAVAIFVLYYDLI